jgi:hypothetical protein
MVRLRHPRALEGVDGHPPRTIPSDAVGDRVTVDADGVFEVDDATDARPLAEAYGVALDALAVESEPSDTDADADDDADSDDTADDTDGEPAAAEQLAAGVCPWCPDDDRYEGDHVGQHASSAHPDEWDAHNA